MAKPFPQSFSEFDSAMKDIAGQGASKGQQDSFAKQWKFKMVQQGKNPDAMYQDWQGQQEVRQAQPMGPFLPAEKAQERMLPKEAVAPKQRDVFEAEVAQEEPRRKEIIDRLTVSSPLRDIQQRDLGKLPTAELEKRFEGATGVQRAIKKSTEIQERVNRGELMPLEGFFQVLGEGGGVVGDIGFDTISALATRGTQAANFATFGVLERPVTNMVKDVTSAIVESPVGQAGIEALKGGIKTYDAWKLENPRIADNLEAGLKLIDGALTLTGAGALATKGPKAALKVSKGAVKKGEQFIEAGLRTEKALARGVEEAAEAASRAIREKISSTPIPKIKEFLNLKTADEKIQALISPRLLRKEKMKAIKEGRVKEARQSFIFGRQADEIIPDDAVVRSSETIKRLIESPELKTQFELHDAMVDKVNDIAKTLRPELAKVRIDKSIMARAEKAWKGLKKQQLDSPLFAEHKGAGKKVQERFERVLTGLKDKKKGNFDNIWDSRIDWDNFFPDSVKTATPDSPTIRQLQKDMWLEGRQVFNDLLKEHSGKLAGRVKTDFSDMSDLYGAIKNIEKNADIDVKGKSGVLKQVLTGVAKGAGLAGAGALVF